MSDYSSLPTNVKDFIQKRIDTGWKNTYHSLMSTFKNKNPNVVLNEKEQLRKEYIERYKIEKQDEVVFNYLFNYCYKISLKKYPKHFSQNIKY